jgi:hypothetical protein
MSADTVVDLAALLPSWKLSLQADRKSTQTVDAYTTGARLFLEWCAENENAAVLDRPTVRQWVTVLLDGGAGPGHCPHGPDGAQALQRVAAGGG